MAKQYFRQFAERTARCTGSALIFAAACAAVVAWALTGPLFHFSDTWQLIINTGTTIITFLMVFLIQNTQNRDAQAVQLKLNELLRATQGAHIGLIDLEELDEPELKVIRDKYLLLAREAHVRLKMGEQDNDTPEIMLT